MQILNGKLIAFSNNKLFQNKIFINEMGMKPASSQRKEGVDESSDANLIQVPKSPPYANQRQSPDFWLYLQ